MARVRLVAVLLVGSIGVAKAGGPTRKVTIESDPPGAKVYFNSEEDGVVCAATPCTVDAPIGQTPAIIELDKYGAEFISIDVPKRSTKPLVFSVKLKSTIGTIVIDAAAAKGATIRVDGADKGKVPQRVDVDPGEHKVVVAINGKTLFEDTVSVETGKDTMVTPKPAPAVAVVTPPDPGSGDPEGSAAEEHVTKAAPARQRDRFIVASAVYDIGWRHFTYDNVTKGSLHDETEDAQSIGGVTVELWPAELFHSSHLRGLSVFGRAETNLHDQAVTFKSFAGQVTTFWGSYELSVRHRWLIADTAAIEVNGGYVLDQFQFNATNPTDIQYVPDAAYQSIRLGVRGAIVAGSFEPYFSAENRIVLSGGDIQSRFEATGTAKASGLRGAVGAVAHFGKLSARLEASLVHYSWTFTSTAANPMVVAGGALDSVKAITASLGYEY